MAINATNKSDSNYEPIAAGVYVARCYYMCEIGNIPVVYMSETKWQKKVHVRWELPTEMKVFKEENGEQPLSISNEYTLSMNEKSNLRKMLENWRGKVFTEAEAENFDITQLLGKPCMISIIHNTKGDKTYANISSVSALPKGTTCPPQINETFEFSFENFDQAKFDSLPDWLKEKIKKSDEYKVVSDPNWQGSGSQSGGSDEQDNDLPFRYSPRLYKFNI